MKFKFKSKLALILIVFFCVTLTLVLAKAETTSNIKEGHIFIENPGKNGSFFISVENNQQNEFISPVLRADFPFNALYAKWQSETLENLPDIYVRFLNEGWGDWLKVEIDDDANGKEKSYEQNSQMIPTKLTDSFQYRIYFRDNQDRKSFKNLDFTYLDTTRGSTKNIRASLAQNEFSITARKSWGADETYRYDVLGNPLWQEEYYTPKRFVIHHTAGEDPSLNIDLAIRAIYYWHAKVKGWGDVGYNYIIDSKGNIYEGRFGGDGVVGGHAYMNNRNSIGIAILGCYENANGKKNSTCNTPDHLTDAAQTALNKLIAAKSREFNIDPMGQSDYQGKMMPNILGHRDLTQTTCPGSLIYNLLPQIRQLSYNLLQEEGGYKKTLPTSAEFVRQSASEINIEETKTADVIVEYKNTGQETWRGYEDNYLFISDQQIKNKLAKINDVKMAMTTGERDIPETAENLQIYRLMGGNVYPGEIGQFKLALNPPQSVQKEIKTYVLAWSDKGYFSNTEFSIALNKVPCTSCNQINNSNTTYKADLINATLNEKVGCNETQEIKLQFKNIGDLAWLPEKLSLKVINGKQESVLNSSEIVNPSGTINFNFKLKISENSGSYNDDFILIYEGQEIFKFSKTFLVMAPYSAEIIENTIPDSMVRNTRRTVTLTLKNTGTKTWKLPTLKSNDIDGTNSWFKDWTWLNSKTIKQIKKQIKPGEEITFKFKLLAYWKANTYPNVYKLFDGKNQIFIGGTKEFKTSTIVTKK